MDSVMSDLLLNPEEWPSNPDDFMDLFQLDTNLLFSEASNGGTPDGGGMNDISASLINNLQNGFSSYGAGELGMMANLGLPEQAMSPLSSLSSDQEFHGFPGSTTGSSLDECEDEFMGDASPEKEAATVAVVPAVMVEEPEDVEPTTTIKMDLDDGMAEFNAFERSVAEQQQLQQALSSAASDSGLSSDNLDFATDYEALSPALSSPGPSISERGGQNSPPRYVKQEPIQKPHQQQIIVQQPQTMTTSVPAVMSKAGKAVYQTVKTVISNGAQQLKKASPAKVIVEKVNGQELEGGTITAGGGLVLSKDQLQTTQLVNGKEVKIYRVATTKAGQAVANNLNKKVTLQLKNGSTATGKSGGTVFLNNKNVVLTSGGTPNGVRKIIRVQQQQQQNGRSILVPVSIQDLRTIKIVNPANLKAKSANIKLAAANLLQQSKQGLIQKNVVLSKDQLVMDEGDTAPSSDNESFVFEDIMQQSNSVIEQVQKQQQHHHSLVSDSDAEDLDDDLDGDDGASLTGGKTASGGYQKLVLTAEEKRLLAKEGISLPTSYPLTKHEERELKRIRRKIRNKISAQDSRKRKKEYVDGLEERVKQCTEENQTLLKRIKILQSQNHDLMSQMKKIQSLLTKGTGKTTQPATCLMVLLLSMALVAVPNLKLGGTHQQQNIQDSIEMAELLQDAATEKTQVQTPQTQSRRSLLFDTKEQLGDALVDEEINFDEIMAFNVNSLIANEHDYTSEEEPPKAKKAKTGLVDYDVDDDIWNGSSKMRIKQEAEETLFNQKAAQFQRAFEQTIANSEHSSGFNIKSEVIVDRDLLEKPSAEFYSTTFAKDGHSIDLLAAGGKLSSDVEEANKKLNASQQIQQQNNKRKLLL